MSKMKSKILVAFDFDNTIIDDNSDLYIKKLAPDGVIPPEIMSQYSSKGWTIFMGTIFAYLHENGRTQNDIEQCLKEIKFTNGMKDLLHYLQDDMFEVVIISDANSHFIKCIMEAAHLDHVIKETFTNPAHFNENGCLLIEYYHTQDWCDRSTVNLCKGHILDSYIEKRAKESIQFKTVAYVGDGTNDLCPSLRLRAQDVVYPRIGFSLYKKINSLDPDTALLAKVSPWETGFDILESLKCF